MGTSTRLYLDGVYMELGPLQRMTYGHVTASTCRVRFVALRSCHIKHTAETQSIPYSVDKSLYQVGPKLHEHRRCDSSKRTELTSLNDRCRRPAFDVIALPCPPPSRAFLYHSHLACLQFPLPPYILLISLPTSRPFSAIWFPPHSI